MADNPYDAPGMTRENPYAGAEMTRAPTGELEDVAKTAVSEAAKGPLRPVGFIGDIREATGAAGEWIARKIGVNPEIFERAKELEREHKLIGSRGAPTTEDIARGVERATGVEFHQPETRAGKYAGAVAGGLTDPLSVAMGPGGIARRMIVSGLSGAGSEFGYEKAGPVGSVLAGGLTSAGLDRAATTSARRATRAANAATQPSEQDIRAASTQGYQTARNMNMPVPRTDVALLGQTIRQDLVNNYGFRPFNEPKTFAAVRLLEEPQNMTGRQLTRRLGTASGLSSISELLSIRDTLQNVRRNNPGTSDGRAASRALEHLDNELQNIPGLEQVMRQARGDYRAAERASDLTNAVDIATRRAQERGGSMAGNLRHEINNIINDDRLVKTPQEEAAMRAIVAGGGIPQELARLGPNHWLWGLWALMHGHPVHAAMLVAPGSIGRWRDNANTRRTVEELRDSILRGAPSGGPPALPMATGEGTVPAAVIRSLDALSEEQQNDPLR